MIRNIQITVGTGKIFVDFIWGFIETYLIAIFYNFLAPKIGKIKFELIDA